MRYAPIETPLGQLHGRDCIYLDEVEHRDGLNTLVLKGALNGNLCSRPLPGRWVPYVLVFSGVLALTLVELDASCESGAHAGSSASFEEVVASPWLGRLGLSDEDDHHHFVVHTYDHVFDILALGFEFSVTKEPMLRRGQE